MDTELNVVENYNGALQVGTWQQRKKNIDKVGRSLERHKMLNWT